MKILVLSWTCLFLWIPHARSHSGDIAFSEWADKHASASVVEAFNKNNDAPVNPVDIESALQGSLRRTFKEWFVTKSFVSEIQSERHHTILRTISENVANSAPNEIIIAFIGGQHALELAFSGLVRNQPALYVFPEISTKMTFVESFNDYERELNAFRTPDNSAQVDRMLRYLGRERDSISGNRVGEMLKSAVRLSARHYGQTQTAIRTLGDRIAETSIPKLIVFGDLHSANSTDHITSFPIQALKTAGVKTVTFLIEPFGREESFDARDVRKHATLGGQVSTDNDWFREALAEISPVVLKRLDASKTVILPSTLKLANLSDSIRALGLNVQFKGVEIDSSFRVKRSQAHTCEGLFISK